MVGGAVHNIFYDGFSRAFSKQAAAWALEQARMAADLDPNLQINVEPSAFGLGLGFGGGGLENAAPGQPCIPIVDPLADRGAAERQSNAHSLKVALDFLPKLFRCRLHVASNLGTTASPHG